MPASNHNHPEATDRAPSTPAKAKRVNIFPMTQEQADYCREFWAWCQEQTPPISQATLAKMSGLSTTKISRLINGKAEGKLLAHEIKRLKQTHQALLANAATSTALSSPGGMQFHKTPFLLEVEAAVKLCLERAKNREAVRHEDRFVEAVAAEGGGKTCIAWYLERELGALLVGSSPHWGRSYLSALFGVARALNVDTSDRATLEERILEACRIRPRALVFHQVRAQTISPHLLTLWLTLLEETQVTIVVLGIPGYLAALRQLAERKRKRGDESLFTVVAQLYSRATPCEFRDVTADEVATLLQSRFHAVEPEAPQVIAESAQRFGHRRCVSRVIDTLSQVCKDGTVTTHRARLAVRTFERSAPQMLSAAA